MFQDLAHTLLHLAHRTTRRKVCKGQIATHHGITLIIAGILALAFMGFTGMDNNLIKLMKHEKIEGEASIEQPNVEIVHRDVQNR